jgi:hypothetical protein
VRAFLYACHRPTAQQHFLNRLVNPYVQPVLYVRRPGSDSEETHSFPDDDPFFSEVSVLVDNIEDIEADPETSTILCSFEGRAL